MARKILVTALDDVPALVTTLTRYLLGSQKDAREPYRVCLQSVPILLAVRDLLIGWL